MKEQWLRALFLHERKELLKNDLDKHNFMMKIDEQKTAELMSEWFEFSLIQTDPQKKAKFKEAELDQKLFGALIQSTEDLKWHEEILPHVREYQTDWLSILEEVLELHRQNPVDSVSQRTIDLLLRPFLLWGKHQWTEQLQALDKKGEFIQPARLIASVLPTLASQLAHIAGRSFVLELNIAKALEELVGDTPEERFISFVETHVVDPEQLSLFFQEYAVIARSLTERTLLFVSAIVEAVSRYLHDLPSLRQTFSLQDSPLVRIDAGSGDSHQQGRTVMRLFLDSGQSLMYKPKPTAVTLHFQKLLEWINMRGFSPKFTTMRVIDCKDYGYEEFIETKGCNSEEQIDLFYYRLGSYLGIIYFLEGTDFHYENLIACGEHPVLIDLETLFHNQVYQEFPDSAEIEAQLRIRNSPMGTSLLPLLFHQDDKGFGIELSGLNGREQLTPYPVLSIENVNTDEMRYVRKPQTTSISHNRPSINGIFKEAGEYASNIVDGFRSLCVFFLKHRTELLSDSGPLACFAEDPVRIVLRSTQFYMNFLLESWHPDYGRDALDLERLLDRMWFSWLDERVIASEVKDLRCGDIPYFTTLPGSRDLWDSRGTRIPEFFAESGMQKLKTRMQTLDEEQIDIYCQWISASISGSFLGKQIHMVETIKEPHQSAPNLPTASSAAFLEEARRIGDELVRQAVFSRSGKNATWIGMNLNYREQLHLSPLGGGLYDGTGGIALFLAQLGHVTGEQIYTDTALAALESTLHKLPLKLKFPSAFYGQASVLYILSHLEALLGDRESWKQHRADLLDNLTDSVEEDTFFDLLGGAAGVIQVLLNEFVFHHSEKALKVAIRYGDHLIKYGRKSETGMSWISSVFPQAYVGFGHGSIGIAWSLYRLAAATGNSAYRTAAEEAVRYLRASYSPEQHNWIDYIQEEGHQLSNWCHGSTGIGLGLILCRPYMQEQHASQAVEEIETAVFATQNHGFGHSHCICHGELGNLELLLTAGEALNRPEWIEQARSYAAQSLTYYQNHGTYITGIPTSFNTPGLWLGLAGIGYQMLRLSSTVSLPSILTLQEPLIERIRIFN
ncbi:type 2 lanthipeptide synthetase LanM family protein [Paenibacillus zanthoxyli]|uniref:type 2 lanthipeptide synthetase LanM family protein n=1 Tax=Paenibacillus zanthoxyli TaxID=369399 RepID=UPI00047200FE|nr:type 2 lanthipeptide synthetase LanM [Paenibacillus zanthoxyli]